MPSIRLTVLGLLLACAAAGLHVAVPASAASSQLAFSPPSSAVGIGGSVNVDVTVANVSNLGGYDLEVHFTPSVVHMTSLTDAGFVTGGANIVVCNPASINNSTGVGSLSCATVSPFGTPSPGVSTVAPIAMARATFQGFGQGQSSLTLTGTTLQTPTGAPIAVKLGTGGVTSSQGVGGMAGKPAVDGPAQTLASEPAAGIPIALLAGAAALAGTAGLIGVILLIRANSGSRPRP